MKTGRSKKPEKSDLQAKISEKIEEISFEFVMQSSRSPESIEQERRRLSQQINQEILAFYKMNPKSKLEQLQNFARNMQAIVAERMDFPHIKKGPFRRNETFFEARSSNEISKE